jgi:hypothetical protein
MRRVVSLIFCSILAVSFPVLLMAANKTVKVGIYQNKPKVFVNSAGEPRGFFIDILNHIASKEGWQLDYVSSTWEKTSRNWRKQKSISFWTLLNPKEELNYLTLTRKVFFQIGR